MEIAAQSCCFAVQGQLNVVQAVLQSVLQLVQVIRQPATNQFQVAVEVALHVLQVSLNLLKISMQLVKVAGKRVAELVFKDMHLVRQAAGKGLQIVSKPKMLQLMLRVMHEPLKMLSCHCQRGWGMEEEIHCQCSEQEETCKIHAGSNAVNQANVQ